MHISQRYIRWVHSYCFVITFCKVLYYDFIVSLCMCILTSFLLWNDTTFQTEYIHLFILFLLNEFVLTHNHTLCSKPASTSIRSRRFLCVWSKHCRYHKDIYGEYIHTFLLVFYIRVHSKIVLFIYGCKFWLFFCDKNATKFQTEYF